MYKISTKAMQLYGCIFRKKYGQAKTKRSTFLYPRVGKELYIA